MIIALILKPPEWQTTHASLMSHEFRFSHYYVLEKSLQEFSKASLKKPGISEEIVYAL